MGSNCTWNAGIVGNYTPDRIMKADSTGIELTGSVLYEVAGNIGIGAAPTGSKLEVNGTFRLGTNGTSLNNILKHAKATLVTINIEANHSLKIEITDNGTGIDLEKIRQFGNGLRNIARRMEAIGGHFKIENKEGTVTTLELPL